MASDTAWSVDYQIGTQFGTSIATASGMVRAVVTTATIIGQWEFNDGVSATVGSIPGAVDRTVLFAQPTIPATGGPSNRGGVAVNGSGHLFVDDPGAPGAQSVLQQQSWGVSIYAQIGALTTSSTVNGQIVHKDQPGVPGGWVLEYHQSTGGMRQPARSLRQE